MLNNRKKNYIIIVVFVLVLLLTLIALGVYFYFISEINKYKPPMMVLNADISKPGKYRSHFSKKFEPNYLTSICIIEDNPIQKITENDLKGLDARFSLLTPKGKVVYEGIFGANSLFSFKNGRTAYALGIANKFIPIGEYEFVLEVKKGASKCAVKPHKLYAYATYEFLPMMASLSLITTIFLGSILLIMCFLLRKTIIAWFK